MQVIKKTLDPVWDERFEFWVPDVLDFEFQISLWDWDFGKHDPLGYVSVKAKNMEEYLRSGKTSQTLDVKVRLQQCDCVCGNVLTEVAR